jgi:hypothetical protein
MKIGRNINLNVAFTCPTIRGTRGVMALVCAMKLPSGHKLGVVSPWIHSIGIWEFGGSLFSERPSIFHLLSLQEKRMEIMKGLHEAINLREVPRWDLTMGVWLLDIERLQQGGKFPKNLVHERASQWGLRQAIKEAEDFGLDHADDLAVLEAALHVFRFFPAFSGVGNCPILGILDITL